MGRLMQLSLFLRSGLQLSYRLSDELADALSRCKLDVLLFPAGVGQFFYVINAQSLFLFENKGQWNILFVDTLIEEGNH